MKNSKISIRKTIFQEHKVQLAYLFGSRAKGNASSESDFDVGVLFEEIDRHADFFDKTVYLKKDLRDFFPREVDVAALNGASGLLKYEVIANGQLLYAKDEKLRLDFEVSSINEYFEDKYVRDIYHNALKKRVAEGVF